MQSTISTVEDLPGERKENIASTSKLDQNRACEFVLILIVSKLVDRSRGRPEGSLFVSYYLSVGVGATPIPGFYTTYPRSYP